MHSGVPVSGREGLSAPPAVPQTKNKEKKKSGRTLVWRNSDTKQLAEQVMKVLVIDEIGARLVEQLKQIIVTEIIKAMVGPSTDCAAMQFAAELGVYGLHLALQTLIRASVSALRASNAGDADIDIGDEVPAGDKGSTQGNPDFWPKVFSSHEAFEKLQLSEKDVKVLAHLQDVAVKRSTTRGHDGKVRLLEPSVAVAAPQSVTQLRCAKPRSRRDSNVHLVIRTATSMAHSCVVSACENPLPCLSWPLTQ